MGPIFYCETSVRNYHYSLRNNPTEGSSRLFRGRSLKSSTLIKYFVTFLMNVRLENLNYTSRWNSHCTLAKRKLWSADHCTIRNPSSDRPHTSPTILPSPTRQLTSLAYVKLRDLYAVFGTQVENALRLIFRRSTAVYTRHIWLQITQGKSCWTYL